MEIDLFGPLAQLVEQLTLNQRVGGSKPPRPTNNSRGLRKMPLFYLTHAWANVAELVDALDLGSSGGTRGSSSLSIRTI